VCVHVCVRVCARMVSYTQAVSIFAVSPRRQAVGGAMCGSTQVSMMRG
jgi:hypothetical protein